MPSNDRAVLRDLARQYRDLTLDPLQQARRELWRRHNSLKSQRPLILATYGMWNVWCRELWGDHAMRCADPFFREHERSLRMLIFHHSIGDDYILEPPRWSAAGAFCGASRRDATRPAWKAAHGVSTRP
jgi:hypothetical protein